MIDTLPEAALAIVQRYRTCELTTIGKDGAPSTWPVCARRLADGRFLLSTSIGLPHKAFNVRRNPHVSLLFSEPRASGVAEPGCVLVQGLATAEDRIVTDPSTEPDLETYLVENIFARQPAGKMWSSWLGRRLMWPYYMRILIYVSPTCITHWPSRDPAGALETMELADVG